MARKLLSAFFITVLFFSAELYANDSIYIQKNIREIEVTGKGTGTKCIIPSDVLIAPNQSVLNNILELIPSFETDLEGNVRLRGSDKMTILINGKPTALLGDYRSEVLIQYPASAIERIEVNYIPDATRLSDGSAGIIDIILKQSYNGKMSGSVHADVANNDRYSAGGTWGASLGKVSVNVNAAYKKEMRQRAFKRYDRDGNLLLDNTAKARPQTVTGHIGVNYSINSANRLGGEASYFYLNFDRIGNIINPKAQVRRDNEQSQKDGSGSLFYEHTFSLKGRIRIEGTYRKSVYREDNQNTRISTNPHALMFTHIIDQSVDEYDANLSYLQRLADGQVLKAGYNGRWQSADNEYNKDNRLPRPSILAYNTDFCQNIQSLYAQYEINRADWEARAGLRGEYYHRHLSLSEAENKSRTDWYLLPFASLSYRINGSNSVSIDYGRRVNRPVFSQLNPTPIPSAEDETYNVVGNPDVKPEFIDNLSLSYEFRHPIISIVPSLYYRHRDNGIAEIIQENADSKTIGIVNIFDTNTTGLDLSLRISPLSWLNLNIAGNVYHDEIQADKRGGIKKDWAQSVRGTADIKLSPNTLLQCTGLWYSDIMTVQGCIKSHYRIDTGITQQVFARRGEVSLSVTDWLNSARETIVIDTPDLYQKNVKTRDSRIVRLGFAWNFHSK
ncbi:TonB-dependent receptor domain-containing protein [Gabonia massiliensis]|uniref:TonB-dependent receptor domain-containing protein n=1 Tax=Gabonia massiliensis TaxID=1686296 RepID=UPI0006D7FCB9|nr:TonB-dependent receptor [Gabonia massiliensis]